MFFSLLILAFFSFFEMMFSRLLRKSSTFIAVHYAARIENGENPTWKKKIIMSPSNNIGKGQEEEAEETKEAMVCSKLKSNRRRMRGRAKAQDTIPGTASMRQKNDGA
ncbi:hypothetical protein V8C34DRAFT_139280 [Trichoderma compactum]